MISFVMNLYISICAAVPTFVLTAVMGKCLLILLYTALLYIAICGVKRLLKEKLNAWAGYYCWYILLFSLPLSGLDINNHLKLPVYHWYFRDMPIPPQISLSTDSVSWPWLICCAAAIVWFLTVLYRVERQIISNAKLEGAIRLMKKAEGTDGMKAMAAGVFGLRTERVSIVMTECVSSPLTYGVFQKTILLPVDYASRYSQADLYHLLLHEMAHIKNGDTLKLYFVSLLQNLFLLPPGFVKSFKRDSEILCDNRVLGVQNTDPDVYGELLLKESLTASPPAIKGFAFSDSFLLLESRLSALHCCTPAKLRFAVLAWLLAAALLSVFAGECAAAGRLIPVDNQFDIIVLYAGENFESVELENAEPTAIRNALLAGRTDSASSPPKEFFSGVYEIVGDNRIKVDRIALYETARPLMNQNEKVESVYFCYPNYDVFTGRKSYTLSGFNMESLQESIAWQEIPRYDIIDWTPPFQDQLFLFAKHWL